jgi:hypothetical protein
MAFLIVGFLSAGSYADCHYFRVSAKLLKCGPAEAKALDAGDAYATVTDVPELQDPSPQALEQVVCECAYSLQGSDPRCDFDQTIERSSVIGSTDLSQSCRRGPALCRDVCPSLLP